MTKGQRKCQKKNWKRKRIKRKEKMLFCLIKKRQETGGKAKNDDSN